MSIAEPFLKKGDQLGPETWQRRLRHIGLRRERGEGGSMCPFFRLPSRGSADVAQQSTVAEQAQAHSGGQVSAVPVVC